MTKQELEAAGVNIHLTKNEDNGPQVIRHLDCSTAHMTLGLQKTPIGNQDKQLAQLKQKSDHILQAIGTSSVTRTEATLAWDTMYILVVAYPLEATHFQEKDLNKLKNKALASILPKIGFNWHTPRAVVYGPQECGGIGIKNLFVEQSVKQI
jgi:hypothetical protein